MTVDLKKVNRIIFQPTKENAEKLKKIAEQNNVSISTLLNQLIDEMNTSASMSFSNLDINNAIDLMKAYDRFKHRWKHIKDNIRKNPIKPFSEYDYEDENCDGPVYYDDEKPMNIEVSFCSGHNDIVTIYPIVLDRLIDEQLHCQITSDWDKIDRMTFGIEIYKNPKGKICHHNIYGLFKNKPVYCLRPEWVDGDAIIDTINKRKEEFGNYYVDIFEDNYYWKEECLY